MMASSDSSKKVKEETLDRLSQLPEALQVQILSILPAKDAVTSCVLSKRWRYLWTSIYNFHFSNRNFNTVQNFISFVDQVLTHSACSKVNKFQVDFHHMSWEFGSKISEWLDFAVEKEVEHVVLHSYRYPDHEFSYELPLSMYTCSSLITLSLSYWVFDKEKVIAWKSLKSLTLHLTTLKDEDIVKLLSSCPSLEIMELSFCMDCRRLEITSSNLKRLTLRNPWPNPVEGYDYLEIFAPHLQHLDISGKLGDFKCRLLNGSSLVIASLTFSMSCITAFSREYEIEEDSCRDYHQVIRNLIFDYLQKLRYTTELIIGRWFAEVLLMMKLEGMTLPELSCKCLTLKLHVMKYYLYGIASLLQTSPLLESLNIHIEDEFNGSACRLERSYFAAVRNMSLPDWIPNTVFTNLKNIKIVSCLEECLKDWSVVSFCKLLELLKFLLENAVVLQKVVIMAKRRKCCTCSENCASRHLSWLAKKLLESPISSLNVVIICEEIA